MKREELAEAMQHEGTEWLAEAVKQLAEAVKQAELADAVEEAE